MTALGVPILAILLVLFGNVKSDFDIQNTFFGTVPGFYDISLNNFKGVNGALKWTYKFTARTGDYKLSMHFFTKLEGNVDIKIFDGPDRNAAVIDVSSIVNNPIFSNDIFRAPHVTASGRQMFVEITELQPTSNDQLQDFQAIVTDHQNKASDGCNADGDLVLACTRGSGATAAKFAYTMKGTNCINVLRSVDTSNDPTQTSFLQFPDGSDGVKVYKGLDISTNNQLLTNVSPFPVTDRNIIISRTAPTMISYYWGHMKSAVTLKDFDYNQIGSVMTRDFISFTPTSLQTKVSQSFDLNPSFLANYPIGTPFTIEFSILKQLGGSQLIISSIDPTGNYVSTTNVTDNADGSLPVKLQITGSRILMSYGNDKIPFTNGLYATYQLKAILGDRVTSGPRPPVTKAPPGKDKASSSRTPISVLVLLLMKWFA